MYMSRCHVVCWQLEQPSLRPHKRPMSEAACPLETEINVHARCHTAGQRGDRADPTVGLTPLPLCHVAAEFIFQLETFHTTENLHCYKSHTQLLQRWYRVKTIQVRFPVTIQSQKSHSLSQGTSHK